MPYILPQDVISPKLHWDLRQVLADGGLDGCSYAAGEWDGERRIGCRWNGNDANPIGNPQSRGLPTWMILDPQLNEAVIRLLRPEMQAWARRFLGLTLLFDGIMMSDDRTSVMLFNIRERPPIVATIACDDLRRVLAKPSLSPEECRLVADRNKDILEEAADFAVTAGRIRTAEDRRSRVVELGLPDLSPFTGRFSSTVLDIAATLGTGGAWRAPSP